jgi:hypothetical protein
LFETGEADELETINAGRIQAARIDYVGGRPDHNETPSTKLAL